MNIEYKTSYKYDSFTEEYWFLVNGSVGLYLQNITADQQKILNESLEPLFKQGVKYALYHAAEHIKSLANKIMDENN